MQTTIVELKPERQLLDPNFDSYKLSLEPIPKLERVLPRQVDRILLNHNQYTYLHTKLYGLHNHLFGDPFDEDGSVYYVDKDRNVCKIYVHPTTHDIISPIVVFTIPKRSRKCEQTYNATIKFVNSLLAVISDGCGMLYLVFTGPRKEDEEFEIVYQDEVIDERKGFVICDAVYKETFGGEDELHVLLLAVDTDRKSERFSSVIYWVSISKKSDDTWGQVSLRQLLSKGEIQYMHLEKGCEAVYVVSDNECKFTLNSEFPVKEETDDQPEVKKTYTWSQDDDELIIKVKLPEVFDKKRIKVTTETSSIEVKLGDDVLLSGNFYGRVEADLTTYLVDRNCLEIALCKSQNGLKWPELIPGDRSGEYVFHPSAAQRAHESLFHLCSEDEETPPTGLTFNSQQTEECDFENDKNSMFQRLCGSTNRTTHKINLGSHHLILQCNLHNELPPALGIRYDVDVCLWQPRESDANFKLKHEGTLSAIGYVQASKQSRKYCVCSPDLSYTAISEASRHVFIYRQNKPIVSSELRNRITNRTISTVAQQQVVNMPDEEIIGIYPTKRLLFLLGECFIIVLKM